MQITETHTFDHPIERCWEMFHDPASHVAKFEAMGHRDVQVVEEERTDTGLRLVVDRMVDVEVPGFARKVIKPTNLVRSTDHWTDRGDGTYGGTFDLETKGVPMTTSGRTLLEPLDGGRTHYEVTIELEVKVPLIGGRIAEFSKGIIHRQMAEEFRLGDAWLDTH